MAPVKNEMICLDRKALAFALLALFVISAGSNLAPTYASSEKCAVKECVYVVANNASTEHSVVDALAANGTSGVYLSVANITVEWCAYGVTYDAKSGMLFVTDPCLDKIFEINPATNKLTNTIGGVKSLKNPEFIACDDAIPECFVTGQGVINTFNPETLAFGSPIKQCAGGSRYLAIDYKNDLLYVSGSKGRGCITVFNLRTGTTKTIKLDGSIVGLTSTGGKVYVDEVYINRSTNAKTNYVLEIVGTHVAIIPHSGQELKSIRLGPNVYNGDGSIWVTGANKSDPQTFPINITGKNATFGPPISAAGNGLCVGRDGTLYVLHAGTKKVKGGGVTILNSTGALGGTSIGIGYLPTNCATTP